MLSFLCCCKGIQHAKGCCSHVVCNTSDNSWIVTIVITVAILIGTLFLFKFIESVFADYHYWKWRENKQRDTNVKNG